MATALGERLGVKVRAVSLLHSTRVDEAELDGRTAELLEPAVEAWAAAGGKARRERFFGVAPDLSMVIGFYGQTAYCHVEGSRVNAGRHGARGAGRFQNGLTCQHNGKKL